MADIQKVEIEATPALNGTYISQMDMWPLECQEFNRIYQFYDNLKEGRFTTTKCQKCGHVAYPPVIICPECWSEEMEWIDLPQTGKVVTFTETQAGAPIGFEPPLIIAWLNFGENSPLKQLLARIINCPEGKLKEGDEVRFVVFDIPAHPIEVKKDTKICERVYYAFEPL
ncbi:MAG: Zn-ribbon domain-containing OB-fold protein [Dehalococcoidales bacterium]|nr:Zn-ribbon domain-containing OB-fold protein [Dehalococcoidales bacterium]